jgi:hypothetical protein
MTSSVSGWPMSSEARDGRRATSDGPRGSGLLTLLLLLGVGCADVERGARPPEADAGPDAAAREAGTTDGAGISFASVRPLIDDQCRRCHMAGGMADSSSFLLSGDATAEYTAVRALVNPAAPAESRLLLKATGQQHQGGVIYRATSPEYASLLAWIEAGAAP